MNFFTNYSNLVSHVEGKVYVYLSFKLHDLINIVQVKEAVMKKLSNQPFYYETHKANSLFQNSDNEIRKY